jgi:RHS repeat-associated protein
VPALFGLLRDACRTSATNENGITREPRTRTKYGYDDESRLTSLNSGAATYTYDAQSRRMAKTIGSATTEYVYFNGEVLAEYSLGDALWNDYIFASGRRLASVGTDVLYYHSDHLGSARLMTDSGGNQSWFATYLPFGQEWNPQPTTNHYKFTGKERDSESGNDNFVARYYSSSFGRFMSPDPLGGHQEDPQTMNRYTYVRNNPLSLTDPTGLDFFLQCKNPEHQGCTQVQIDPNNNNQTWVQADKNGAVVITSDSIREGQNTATVDQNGVVINGKDQGIYFKNAASDEERSGDGTDHNPITLAGLKGGALEGFGITINGNCNGTCLSSGTWAYPGTNEQAGDLLFSRGAFHLLGENIRASLGYGDHPYSTQYRFGGSACSLFSCENSPHLSVPNDPKSNVPKGFHVDAHGDYYHHNQDVERKGVQ